MPQFDITIEIEASSVHSLKMMGNDQEHAIANALESIRVGMLANPLRYIETRKVELECVEAVEIEEE